VLTKIRILYYHLRKFPECDLMPNAEYNYSEENVSILTNYILRRGLNVMLLHSGDTLVISIDNGNFKQR